MSESAARPVFAPGDRVRTRAVDPEGHTRLPRYARGCTGRVVAVTGPWPLADDMARRRAEPGVEPRVEPVYTVAFAARELWGEGGHEVTLDLWQSYLEPYGETQGSGGPGGAGGAGGQGGAEVAGEAGAAGEAAS